MAFFSAEPELEPTPLWKKRSGACWQDVLSLICSLRNVYGMEGLTLLTGHADYSQTRYLERTGHSSCAELLDLLTVIGSPVLNASGVPWRCLPTVGRTSKLRSNPVPFL